MKKYSPNFYVHLSLCIAAVGVMILALVLIKFEVYQIAALWIPLFLVINLGIMGMRKEAKKEKNDDQNLI